MLSRHIAAPAALLLLSGCISINPHGIVEQAERDTTGRFDGFWRVEIGGTDKYQRWSSWQMTCEDIEASVEMVVDDGEVHVGVAAARDLSTYVDNEGHFALAMPTDLEAEEASSSFMSIVNQRVTYYLRGNLSPDRLRGEFIIGVADFGEMGCKTRVRYHRVEEHQGPTNTT